MNLVQLSPGYRSAREEVRVKRLTFKSVHDEQEGFIYRASWFGSIRKAWELRKKLRAVGVGA